MRRSLFLSLFALSPLVSVSLAASAAPIDDAPSAPRAGTIMPMLAPDDLPVVLPELLPSVAPRHGNDDALDAFDHFFRQQLDAAAVPGGAYAIVQDGRIVRASGHGVRVRGSEERVDDDTVFRVASVSKTFAAELTALLVQEGRLRWDDRVVSFIPDLQLKSNKHVQALQVQHLLSQSTGVVSNAYDNLLDANVPLPKILPRFKELKPLCSPGQCYTYQNILFGLIAPVIEQTTHSSYATLVQDRLFDPLQMRHASIGMEAFLATPNRARPHVKKKGVWIATEVQPGYYQVPPAAGINASAGDLGKWLIAQMGHNPDVIPPSVVEELTRKRVRTEKDLRRRNWREFVTDAHYGLGWRIYELGNEEIVLHSGWVKGYVAEVAYSKARGTGLVVLLNAESNVISDITTHYWGNVIASDPALATGKNKTILQRAP